jgi:hypothetical protein
MTLRPAAFAASAIALTLGLAACSPNPAPSASSSPTAAPSEAAAAKRFPLPACGEVEPVDGPNGWEHKDCRLTGAGENALEVHFTARELEPDGSGAPTLATVQVVAPGDATVQTFEEPVENTFGQPSLSDLDGDGVQELMIPLMTGNVNTSYAIWRVGADGKFARAGEMSGHTFGKSGEFVTATNRGGANIQAISYYRFENNELKPLFTAEATARGEDGDHITGVDCAVHDDGGLRSIGKTRAQAQAEFCNAPEVKALFGEPSAQPTGH